VERTRFSQRADFQPGGSRFGSEGGGSVGGRPVLPPDRLIAALAAAFALWLPALAGAQEGPPPDDIPPPATTTPTEPVEPAEPTGPTSITITVPPLPAQKAAPKKAAPQQAKPAPKRAAPVRREPVRRASPRRSEPVESYSEPAVSEEPAAEPVPQKPKPAAKKAKAAKKKVHRAKPRVVAKAAAPVARGPIRDPQPVSAVLGAQFTLGQDDGGMNTSVIVLALMLAGLVGAVAAVVGAAPILADRWPRLFVPVIESTDRIVLAGLCVGGAMVALAITWALTGPSG
jgi:hypothetical protein